MARVALMVIIRRYIILTIRIPLNPHRISGLQRRKTDTRLKALLIAKILMIIEVLRR